MEWKEKLKGIVAGPFVKTDVLAGTFAQTLLLETATGKSFFCKIRNAQRMDPFSFQAEVRGLEELRRTGIFRVPQVLHMDDSLLVLEGIKEGGPKKDFFYEFGQKLARLHQVENYAFGYDEDNFLGASPQRNTPFIPAEGQRSGQNQDQNQNQGRQDQGWRDFFWNYRLVFQFKLCEKSGKATDELKILRSLMKKMENKIETLLQGGNPRPSLLHGDLWSGNYLIDEEGEVVLIDPAVYYGAGETDLAMTKLFGGFPKDFYRGYEAISPLPVGHEIRERVYQVYHLLNHYNLFGRSYYRQLTTLMEDLLSFKH